MAERASSYSIAQVAERTGLSAHTLRYYERDGLLLAAVGRDSAGRRRYAEADLRWIELLTCLRATGMPIRDIKEYAGLVRGGEGNEEARLALLLRHRDVVLRRLTEVQGHLGAIEGKIALYRERTGRD